MGYPLKSILRDWIPPVVIRWKNAIPATENNAFDGDFSNWDEALAQSGGYGDEKILAKVLAAALKVKRGETAFERDSVLFKQPDYAWPMLTALLWTAARTAGNLNVLDFGGSLGSRYFQHRTFLQALPAVHWNVVEQPHYVEAGQAHFQDEQLRFYQTIEDCLHENQPNVILLSAVLQYLASPAALINDLNKVGALSLVIDRSPFSLLEEDRLVVQKVPASIYSASYPMWIFSLTSFERLLAQNWRQVAVNLSPEGHVRTNGGTEFFFQGMLWEMNR